MKTQIEKEANGEKDQPSMLPPTNREKLLTICGDVISTYKSIVVLDEADADKLVRELTKCYITACAIIRKLNRSK